MNIVKRLGIYISIILLTLSLSACGGESKETYEDNIEISHEADEILNVEEMKQDLDFIKNTIKEVHPNPYNNLSEKEFDEKWEALKKKVTEPMEYRKFYYSVLEALSILGDSNTTAVFNEIPYELDLNFTWTKDGAWVNEENGYLKAGDVILKIGDKTLDEIALMLKKIIPSNNEYLVMSLGNDILKDKYALSYLSLLDEKERVKIEVVGSGNDNKIVYLNFKDKEPQNKDKAPFSYNAMPMSGFGVLKFNECLNSDEYKQNVKEFFAEVIDDNISNIAIDLRENTGGDISVLDELLKYVDIDEYEGYNIELNKSKQAEESGLNKKGLISNLFSGNTIKIEHESKELYSGKIYVLTSNKTCNEANEMAVIIKDNSIGKIVGDYTGSSPNGYGVPIKINVPNTGLQLYVSTSTGIRPNEDAANINTLKPDIYVQYTAHDIINGNDPVLEAIKKVVNESE